MIKDNIKNANLYYNLSKRFETGLQYLQNNDFTNFENGKYPILNEEIFASVQDYTSKPQEKGSFEAHKKYADIQFIVKGSEKLGVCDLKNFTVSQAYDEQKDIEFLTPVDPTLCDFFELKQNELAIFYPEDAHMPSLAINKPTYVKKVVIKVLIN